MNRDESLDLSIAVVGLSVRVPGSNHPDEFWRALCGGTEAIRDLSEDELRSAGLSDAEREDPLRVRRAADVDHVDTFDAPLFGFTPREAELTDPQFRAFLECVWEALDDAGRSGDAAERVGVFAGASESSYLENFLARNPRAVGAMGGVQASLGNGRDYLATQASYRLDLRGPALTVSTACSTSLVAVHLAVQSLLNRECDVAVAGGVSITVPQTTGYRYEEGDIASPDGRCRAFDAGAAGTVKGNGCGIVVLRRLTEALEDGDPVRAVIRGSAVNNDGHGKIGFTAPGVEGQAAVIEEALAVADVSPDTIDLIEAHGTGTPLGDPVEVAALAQALGPRPEGPARALGSVKSNVGHLDAAAGVVGLIKAVLALQHGEIPPSLHYRAPNPQLDLDGASLYVNTTLRAWDDPGRPRRAGVSSFGIGGTNAHVIAEEAPLPEPVPADERPQMLPLCAATESALMEVASRLADALEAPDAAPLADVAFTLQAGRRRLPHRRFVTASTTEEAVAALRASPLRPAAVRDERRATPAAFLFPGQGAQYAGMARGLYETEAVFRAEVDECAEILRPLFGMDLRELLRASPDDESAAAALRRTQNTQPVLFALEVALASLWRSRGVLPVAMAGHSIGEYVAAHLAGVWTREEALTLVAHRGRLMGSCEPGSMLAVHLAEADLRRRLSAHPELSLAAVNGPSACVAAGPAEAIDRLEADLAPAGIASRKLQTSHAFHSTLMEPAVAEFETQVRAFEARPPRIPFLSNLTGTWITSEQATDPAYWSAHLRGTVRFADNLAELARDSGRVLLEVGPGTALSSLARPLGVTAIGSLPPARDGDEDVAADRTAMGHLWAAGVDLDWARVHGAPRRRVRLPAYPFERQRFWIDADPESSAALVEPAKEPDVSRWFYAPGWRTSRARPESDAAGTWLLLDDGSMLGEALARRGERRGVRVVRQDASTPAEQALRAVPDGFRPTRIVYLGALDARDPDGDVRYGFHALLSLVRQITRDGTLEDVRLVAATRGLFDVTGEAVRGPERAAMLGVTRVAPLETPGLTTRLVDVHGDDDGVAEAVARELTIDDGEPLTAWRGGRRWVPSFEAVPLARPTQPPAPIREDGVYLLTGGEGDLECALGERLLEEGARAVAFLRAGGAPADGADSRWIRYAHADGPAAVRDLRERLGSVDAVFHTAGSIGGGMIQLKTAAEADGVLAPRLEARGLADSLRDEETLVLFSSSISETGVFGQVDYCAASAYLDAFSAARRGSGARVRVLDWGMAHWDRWDSANDETLAAQLREIRDEIGITVDEGVDALLRGLSSEEDRLIVSVQDLAESIRQARDATVGSVLSAAVAGGAPRKGGQGGALETETEERVAAAWEELLGVGNVGRGDSFLDLGGNSLLAIQLASALRKAFDIELPIAVLFESPDLAALAGAVDAAVEQRRTEEEVARLLDEIEALPEDEIRAQLDRDAMGDDA